jgi:aminoglycoside phosphotransferase (APT) family kinase protein
MSSCPRCDTIPAVQKADITAALVSELIEAQFPQWAHLAIRPTQVDGWDNATFRLGRGMSVRLPSDLRSPHPGLKAAPKSVLQ